MFEPFWQSGRDRRGAGLGLSICRFIVEAHGGSVWTEPSNGMRVKVLFLLPSAIPKAGHVLERRDAAGGDGRPR